MASLSSHVQGVSSVSSSSVSKVGVLPSLELVQLAAQVADEKKALDLVILETGEVSSLADYFLICSASSMPQIKAISESIKVELKKHGVHPMGQQCEVGSRWHLLDYGDVVIHVFHSEERGFYQLEEFWSHAPQVEPPSFQALQAS